MKRSSAEEPLHQGRMPGNQAWRRWSHRENGFHVLDCPANRSGFARFLRQIFARIANDLGRLKAGGKEMIWPSVVWATSGVMILGRKTCQLGGTAAPDFGADRLDLCRACDLRRGIVRPGLSGAATLSGRAGGRPASRRSGTPLWQCGFVAGRRWGSRACSDQAGLCDVIDPVRFARDRSGVPDDRQAVRRAVGNLSGRRRLWCAALVKPSGLDDLAGPYRTGDCRGIPVCKPRSGGLCPRGRNGRGDWVRHV